MEMVAGVLINLAYEANLKGAILITFEGGTRHLLPVAGQDEYMQPLVRVAKAIETDFQNKEIQIPDCLN
jgi:hypothetical protein